MRLCTYMQLGSLMNIATTATVAATIITTLIAALVAVITWRQWITNRARLRHELFDLRYGIFEQIASFVDQVVRNGTIQSGAAQIFLRQTKRAYFAFGCDQAIKKLVDNIYSQALLLQTLQVQQQAQPANNAVRQLEVVQWFNATLDSLEERFEKYLRLEH